MDSHAFPWSAAFMQIPDQKNSKRLGYPPSEYARLNGRHPSWAYRQLYAGKLKAITSLGRLLIPVTEVERVMTTASPYNPRGKRSEASDTAEDARKNISPHA